MRTAHVVAILDAALARLAEDADELRDLDAIAGDGDLGVTVSRGCAEIRTALAAEDVSRLGPLLRACGAAFARGNPSTLAALVGGGLLAASAAVPDTGEVDRAAVLTAARAAANRIAERGGAQLGDKTLLDALLPSIDALASHDGNDDSGVANALAAMVAAARAGVESTAGTVARRGRAAWVGERGAGSPDAGATAWLRFLEHLRDAWPEAS